MESSTVSRVFASRKPCIRVVLLALTVWALCTTLWLISLHVRGISSTGISSADCLEAKKDTLVATSGLIAYHNLSSVKQQAPPTSRHVNVTPSSGHVGTTTRSKTPLEERLQYYTHRINSVRDDGENCTMVMLTYRRTNVLPKILAHYCSSPRLQRILVIWNDVDTNIPPSITQLADKCEADLRFIQSQENKLTNRYIPRDEIETDCVCLVDDDYFLSLYDIELGFIAWKNFRNQLIGFEERSFSTNPDHTYSYSPTRKRYFPKTHKHKFLQSIEIVNGTRLLHIGNKTFVLGASAHKYLKQKASKDLPHNNGYSILLTSSFIHKAYLEMFFDPLLVPSEAVEYVDKIMNCEDILLSIMVTKFLDDTHSPQSGVLAAKNCVVIKSALQDTSTVLSKRPKHNFQRSLCLNEFARMYGYLPLQKVNNVVTLV